VSKKESEKVKGKIIYKRKSDYSIDPFAPKKTKEVNLVTNEEKLRQMKREAIEKNDVIVYNAIKLYEHNGNDVTVLIKAIKNLYETSLQARQKAIDDHDNNQVRTFDWVLGEMERLDCAVRESNRQKK
jgi:hypothetical protein